MRLGAGAGGRLTLLLNGTEVETVEDGALVNGALGLARRRSGNLRADCMNPRRRQSRSTMSHEPPAMLPAGPSHRHRRRLHHRQAGLATPTGEGLLPSPASLASTGRRYTRSLTCATCAEEVLEASMAVPALFVLFEFEAVRRGAGGLYGGVYQRAGHVVCRIVGGVPPDSPPAAYYDPLGGWKAGMRACAVPAAGRHVEVGVCGWCAIGEASETRVSGL